MRRSSNSQGSYRMSPKTSLTPFERFMRFVNKTDYCWLWTGCKDKWGYGRFKFEKENLAHRASWVFFHGPIPEGMDVLHKCDNPPCVNPDHHYLGTDIENMRDRDERGRTQKGVTHVNSHFTEDQVRSIRSMYRPHRVTLAMLAKKYHVSTATISHIVKREIYKDIK